MTCWDTNDTVSNPGSNFVKLVYELLDTNGAPVLIVNESGTASTTYNVYVTNILPFRQEVFGGEFGSYYVTNTTNVSIENVPLQPVDALSPFESYTAQVTIFQEVAPATSFSATGLYADDGNLPVTFDFTNTVSPDPSPNILGYFSNATLLRDWSISNSPAQFGFPVQVSALLGRYDDYTLPPYATNTTVTFNFELLDSNTQLPVPLQSSSAQFTIALESHDTNSPPNPVIVPLMTNFTLLPAAQMVPYDNYQIIVTMSHADGATALIDGTNTISPQQLFDFSGQLYFGPLLTYFTNLDEAPDFLSYGVGYINCEIDVTTNSGLLPDAPGNTYGNGSPIVVELMANGSAVFADVGQVPINNQNPSGSTQTTGNISYFAAPIELNGNGATENVTLTLPLGVSVGAWNSNSRLTSNTLSIAGLVLNSNLTLPTLTIPGPLKVVCENLPYAFGASSLQWNVSAGTITAANFGGSFARQYEDDQLTNAAANSELAQPNYANRVSNDGYFRNASPAGGVPLVIAADGNGFALVTCQLSLNPPELRPHFPYTSNAPGDEIQLVVTGSASGSVILSNNAVSPASYLAVQSPMPVPYGRDTTNTNCSTSLAGPGTLEFTSPTGQLGFTADGGLLASGSVPRGNLTWGYVGNNNYAQEVYNVEPCVYEMAGVFLAGSQDSVPQDDLAAELLFSGFGDST